MAVDEEGKYFGSACMASGWYDALVDTVRGGQKERKGNCSVNLTWAGGGT